MARIQTDLGKLPGPIFIDNVVAVRLIWKLANNKQASNILHYSFSGTLALSQSSVDSTFPNILTALSGSGMRPFMTSKASLTAMGMRDLSHIPDSPFGHGEWISSIPGLAGSDTTGDPLPAGTAFVVSLQTGKAGQANRGRVYLPGWSETGNDANGTPVTGVQDGAVAFIIAVHAALHTFTPILTPCIAHPARAAYTGRAGAVHPARDAGFEPVGGTTKKDAIWDSQRLRQHL